MKKEDKRVTLHWMAMGNKLFVDTVVGIQKFSVFLDGDAITIFWMIIHLQLSFLCQNDEDLGSKLDWLL